MFLHIKNFSIITDYKLKILFSNDEEAEIDLKNKLEGEIFKPLKDLSFFNKAYLNQDTLTIEWPNGADFAPEFLYEISHHKNKKTA